MDFASLFRSTVERHPDKLALVYGERRWTLPRVVRPRRAPLPGAGGPGCATRRPGRVLRLDVRELGDDLLRLPAARRRRGAAELPPRRRRGASRAVGFGRPGARVRAGADRHRREGHRIAAQRARLDLVRVGRRRRCPRGTCTSTRSPRTRWTVHESRPIPDGEDLSALVYTSGTTGRAKGVMHTHDNDAYIAMNCVMEYGPRQGTIGRCTSLRSTTSVACRPSSCRT